jgi:hypothetical protein
MAGVDFAKKVIKVSPDKNTPLYCISEMVISLTAPDYWIVNVVIKGLKKEIQLN